MLPDKNRLLVADYSRFAFIKRTTNVGFVDGMLIDYDQKTPSLVLGFLAIPKGILPALLLIPSGSSDRLTRNLLGEQFRDQVRFS